MGVRGYTIYNIVDEALDVSDILVRLRQSTESIEILLILSLLSARVSIHVVRDEGT